MDPEWNHEPDQDDATMLGLRHDIQHLTTEESEENTKEQ